MKWCASGVQMSWKEGDYLVSLSFFRKMVIKLLFLSVFAGDIILGLFCPALGPPCYLTLISHTLVGNGIKSLRRWPECYSHHPAAHAWKGKRGHTFCYFHFSSISMNNEIRNVQRKHLIGLLGIVLGKGQYAWGRNWNSEMYSSCCAPCLLQGRWVCHFNYFPCCSGSAVPRLCSFPASP